MVMGMEVRDAETSRLLEPDETVYVISLENFAGAKRFFKEIGYEGFQTRGISPTSHPWFAYPEIPVIIPEGFEIGHLTPEQKQRYDCLNIKPRHIEDFCIDWVNGITPFYPQD